MDYKVTGSKLTEKFLAIVQGFVRKEIDVTRLTELAEKEADPCGIYGGQQDVYF